MYMPEKPIKWGNKVWCRPEISGYVHEFDVNGGKETKGTPDKIQSQYLFGEIQNVILRLVNDLQPNKHSPFQQSFYCSRIDVIIERSENLCIRYLAPRWI